MKNKAYSYIRFSTPEQLKGNSLKRQMEKTEAYCKKNKLALDTSLNLKDLGISAFKGKNAKQGALSAFIQAVEEGKVDSGSTLIVESLDRISRSQIGDALSLFISILNKGIHIVTLDPEREYTKKSINDLPSLLEPLIIMARAHEESQMKSVRLSAAWKAKRESGKKITAQAPSWLVLNKDKTEFNIDEEKAEIVRGIYQDCIDGRGTTAITKTLNQEDVTPIGNAKVWHRSYVTKILKDKATIGEFQFHTTKNGKRVKTGKVMQDYYPPVITESTFYKAQKALASRANAKGKKGKRVANLFTGLLFDANDGSSMTIVNKGASAACESGRKLVSSAAQRGEIGAVYNAFSYDQFELFFLRSVQEVDMKSILAKKGKKTNAQKSLDELEVKHTKALSQLEEVEKAMLVEEGVLTLAKVASTLESKIDDLEVKIETLKAEVSVDTDNHNSDFALQYALVDIHFNKKEHLREKLKQQIREIIKRIDIEVIVESQYHRRCNCVVYFTNGKKKKLNMEQVITRSGKNGKTVRVKNTYEPFF